MRILVGIDGSEQADLACQFIASRSWPLGTRVDLVSAFERPMDWSGMAPLARGPEEDDRAQLEAILEERAGSLWRADLQVSTLVERGAAADILIGLARKELADLIVVGSRGLGPIASAVLGSVSAHLVDHAPCPVLVVRSPGATRMLLAIDGTASSRDIPTVLSSWGHAFRGLPTEVISVASRGSATAPRGLPEPPAETDLGAAYVFHERAAVEAADELNRRGWQASAITGVGKPEDEILIAAREYRADLIVTGSRGLGTLGRLVVGSLSHGLLMHARSSLLVIRGHVPARTGEGVVVGSSAPAAI